MPDKISVVHCIFPMKLKFEAKLRSSMRILSFLSASHASMPCHSFVFLCFFGWQLANFHLMCGTGCPKKYWPRHDQFPIWALMGVFLRLHHSCKCEKTLSLMIGFAKFATIRAWQIPFGTPRIHVVDTLYYKWYDLDSEQNKKKLTDTFRLTLKINSMHIHIAHIKVNESNGQHHTHSQTLTHHIDIDIDTLSSSLSSSPPVIIILIRFTISLFQMASKKNVRTFKAIR